MQCCRNSLEGVPVNITVQGHRLEYEFIRRGGARTIVFLHEGLGSLAMWRDFPARVADATGCDALVYSRWGYGKSDRLGEPRAVDFMHREALETLPELLEKLDVREPVLFGHSDGGSIALIHASEHPAAGLIVMAPHVFVEDLSIASIEEAKRAYETTGLREKLARHHDDPDSAFWGWNDIWLAPEFRAWNIEDVLPKIRCPILAIQGEDDQYGTMEQIRRIEHGARNVETLALANCRHSPHRDRADAVIEAVVRFTSSLTWQAEAPAPR
jgi:pimeloyl-ACP methyl ester carboxylesterase